ncbi:AAA family ATPase [Saccharothrix sp. NPDC042600]|uniref:ATP-binding protein n=1 Tax=Saccharothrix TaxID=2071 RepID=UPI0033F350A6|nr:LuxR C-terminal-related transcriptional regulator [Saccharothrix mutabilis subsp. capreolus]
MGLNTDSTDDRTSDSSRGATNFIGRGELLKTGEAELADGVRLLTLTGPGGVGKTRLADEMARRCRDRTGTVVTVELADVRDADGEVESELARALDLVHNDSDTPSLDFVVEHLRAHRTLLVLDNCEHLIGVLGRPGRLQDVLWQVYKGHPSQQIIATSQAALEMIGIERVLEVPGLACTSEDGEILPEAVQLLMDRIDALQTPAPDIDVAIAICTAVDGFPLAVEMIAGLAKYWSWPEVQELLCVEPSPHEEPKVVAGGGPLELVGNAEKPAHRTLRAVMEASYQRLDGDRQRLWLALSVFGGGFDADAARTVCSAVGIRAATVTTGLARLVHHSVLTRTEVDGRSWYRMHALVRAFGIQVGSEQHRELLEQARQAHADYFWDFARAAGDDWFRQNEVLGQRRIEDRWGNLRAAMTHLLRTDAAPRAFQLVMNLCRSNYFIYRGRLSEALRLLDMCLSPIEGPDMLLVVGRAYHAWTTLLQGTGHVAAEMLAQCRAMLKELPGQEPPTILLFAEQNHRWLTETNPSRAAEAASAVYHLVHREEEYSTDQILIRVFSALAAAFHSDRETAFRITKETWNICEDRGAEMTGAWGMYSYALAQFRHRTTDRDVAAALRLAQQALHSQSANGDLWGQQWSVWLIAVIAAAQGHHAVAARLFGQLRAVQHRSEVSIDGLKPFYREQTTAVAACQDALGSNLFDVEAAQGRNLRFSEAVDLALGLPHDTSVPPATLTRAEPSCPEELTERQWDCVKALVAHPRASYTKIAAILNISPRTFEKHVMGARERTGLATDALVAWATTKLAAERPDREHE